ncbi:MAG: translation initiation factor IF-2 [Desulfovibrio sp.]|jgi:hypothetical protein|nr:translation initiation factor IF-2 [Desulfovibrio sp.]
MGSLFAWIPALAIVVVGLIFCFRMLKRGLSTMKKYRKGHFEHISAQEQQIREDKKNISASEHIHVAYAAIVDLLRLEGDRPGFSVTRQASAVLLKTPRGDIRIRLNMREKILHSTGRVLHGRTAWWLEYPDGIEEFSDLVELMRTLAAYIRSGSDSGAGKSIRRMRRVALKPTGNAR